MAAPNPDVSRQKEKATLEVDGAKINILSARGGELRVVPTPSRLAYGPVEFNAALEEVFAPGYGPWLQNTIDGDIETKTVNVTMFRSGEDSLPAVAHGYTLENARIVGVNVPALDTRRETPAPLSFALKAEKIERDPTGRGGLATTIPQVRWNRCDFRLEVEGLPCDEVIQVSSLAWRPRKGVENLKLAIRRTDDTEGAWYEWFEQAVNGNNGARDGELILANPDRQKEWARIRICRAGIVRFVPRYDTGTHFLVELSVKRIRFNRP